MITSSIFALISRVHEATHQFLVRALARHGLEGLVPSHGDILTALFAEEPRAMKDLARSIGRTRPTVTVLVDKLEAQGFVVRERDAADGRQALVWLSPQGKALRGICEAISEELFAVAFRDIEERDLRTAEALLRHLRDNFHTADSSPTDRNLPPFPR